MMYQRNIDLVRSSWSVVRSQERRHGERHSLGLRFTPRARRLALGLGLTTHHSPLTTHHSPLTTHQPMQCIVVTPEATVLDQSAEFVALPLYDGEIGIAPHHAPMLGRLGYGEMRLTQGGSSKRYYVDGG